MGWDGSGTIKKPLLRDFQNEINKYYLRLPITTYHGNQKKFGKDTYSIQFYV